jgi:hypothetical protein
MTTTRAAAPRRVQRAAEDEAGGGVPVPLPVPPAPHAHVAAGPPQPVVVPAAVVLVLLVVAHPCGTASCATSASRCALPPPSLGPAPHTPSTRRG